MEGIRKSSQDGDMARYGPCLDPHVSRIQKSFCSRLKISFNVRTIKEGSEHWKNCENRRALKNVRSKDPSAQNL